MSEELQELARQIRKQEQAEQESKVKIELMERRLESVKRQGDTIVELEADLAKARKQEKIYQDAMDQLQTDFDQLEQDMVKVKQAVPAERQRELAWCGKNNLKLIHRCSIWNTTGGRRDSCSRDEPRDIASFGASKRAWLVTGVTRSSQISRLTLFAAPSASCVTKIPISRAKTFSERYLRYQNCHPTRPRRSRHPTLQPPRLHPQVCQPRQPASARSHSKQRHYTAT